MIELCLTNAELQVAIIEAGKIVMASTDRTTSGDARRHAADFLEKAFAIQLQRASLFINTPV